VPPGVSARTAAGAASGGAAVPAFHCFAWVHGPAESSTDCYRSEAACEKARAAMTGRGTAPCVATEWAFCTRVGGAPRRAGSGEERCFDRERACARYRAFVGRNGLATTACERR
jgi:hypothetical protein